MARILYCDDQARFRDAFVERHSTHFEIMTVADVGEVPHKLHEMSRLPDLLLLDLYHPRAAGEEQERNAQAAEASLDELDAQLEHTKTAVLNAWSPTGLEMLKALRVQYSSDELPVALYTQKGLLLLDDSELRQAEELDADWLLKKKHPDAAMERIWIDRILHHATADRARIAVTKYKWLLLVSWVVLTVSLATHLFPSMAFADILAKVIAATVGAIAAFVVGRFIGPSAPPTSHRIERA